MDEKIPTAFTNKTLMDEKNKLRENIAALECSKVLCVTDLERAHLRLTDYKNKKEEHEYKKKDKNRAPTTYGKSGTWRSGWFTG
jgi:hypothetical protein